MICSNNTDCTGLFDLIIVLLLFLFNTFFPIIVFFVILTIIFIIFAILGFIKPFGHFDCFGIKNPELMKLRMELLEKELREKNE